MPLDDPPTYREELGIPPASGRFRKSIFSARYPFSWARVRQAAISLTDQIFSVGGMFLVNVALARTQTKYEYGLFALSYSAFIFLLSLHNSAILETFTVYGAGRYQKHFQQYLRLIWRKNVLLGVLSTALLCLAWSLLRYVLPAMASRTFLGMALSLGIVFSATFLRRAFYVRRRPDLAARFSFVFFCSCVVLLSVALHSRLLDGFYGYLITALSWVIAALFFLKEFPGGADNQGFMEVEPDYWSEHWKYSRWVLITAFVFQLTTQGYFWLVASFLTVSDVGNLRALYNVVLPLDQLFVALSMVVLPVMCSRYATQKMAGLLPRWKLYCLSWLAITTGFVVVVQFFGKPAMHLLYAGKFDNISSLVPVVAFLPLVLGTGHTVNGALKAAEKPNFVFYAYSFSGIVTFLFGIPLVIHFGLRGAVYGMLVSGITYTTALLFGLGFLVYSQRPTVGSSPLQERS
jgi:O-antigen/teichoic acid export membrane protein